MNQLAQCTPCRKGDKGLTPEEIRRALQHLPGWELFVDGTAIRKSWKFQNFREALAFVNRVGEVAEEQNHHPDIELGWGYVRLAFTTHAIGGLHRNDFIMAEKVEQVASS